MTIAFWSSCMHVAMKPLNSIAPKCNCISELSMEVVTDVLGAVPKYSFVPSQCTFWITRTQARSNPQGTWRSCGGLSDLIIKFLASAFPNKHVFICACKRKGCWEKVTFLTTQTAISKNRKEKSTKRSKPVSFLYVHGFNTDPLCSKEKTKERRLSLQMS